MTYMEPKSGGNSYFEINVNTTFEVSTNQSIIRKEKYFNENYCDNSGSHGFKPLAG